MARKVKCRFCEMFLSSDDAFIYTNEKGDKKFYCNKEHYIKHKTHRESYDKFIKLSSKIFGINLVRDTAFKKIFKESVGDINSTVENFVATLEDVYVKIDKIINKSNSTQYGKYKYFFALIKKEVIENRSLNANSITKNEIEHINFKEFKARKKVTWLDVIKEENKYE